LIDSAEKATVFGYYAKIVIEYFCMKNFNEWNNLKKDINIKEQVSTPFIHSREIWFMYLGVNVGYEEDGKGGNFLRPVLVYKVFNKNIFWGIPLTTKGKENIFYAKIKENSFAILSQLRLLDTKRLAYKLETISKDEFEFVNKKLKALLP
jgi:mRNA interferase MazF